MPLEILIEHNTKSNFDGLFWFEYVFTEMFNILIFLKDLLFSVPNPFYLKNIYVINENSFLIFKVNFKTF